jgi:hypothetical protein
MLSRRKMQLLEQARVMALGVKLNGTPVSQFLKRPDFDVMALPTEIS